jgi:hypothetical protein
VSELPVLSREQLAGLHFGEGCQLEEYLFLRGLALMVQPPRILEIGTSCGVGGLMLLDGACAFGRQACLTTIDVKRHKAFERNLSLFPHLAERIERIVASSDAALPDLRRQGRRFDLVFVDGDHSAEQALRDWQGVEPLADRFVLHDTDQMPGCRALVAAIRQADEFDVLPLTYPLGHQVFHGMRGAGRVYDGLYHQTQLVWTANSAGPGLTLVQRRPADGS